MQNGGSVRGAVRDAPSCLTVRANRVVGGRPNSLMMLLRFAPAMLHSRSWWIVL